MPFQYALTVPLFLLMYTFLYRLLAWRGVARGWLGHALMLSMVLCPLFLLIVGGLWDSAASLCRTLASLGPLGHLVLGCTSDRQDLVMVTVAQGLYAAGAAVFGWLYFRNMRRALADGAASAVAQSDV